MVRKARERYPMPITHVVVDLLHEQTSTDGPGRRQMVPPERRMRVFAAAAYDEARASSLLDRTLYADHVTYLAGDLLPKTDRMTMAHSVEARAPFLDAAWVEWTARLPER